MATRNDGEIINEAMAAENWADALKHIERCLADDPDCHWMWATGSSAHYEMRNYKEAVVWIERAYAIMPDCPLVLWHQASVRSVLALRAGIDAYQKILERGLNAFLHHPCTESEAWGRRLYNDCRFSIARLVTEGDLQSRREHVRAVFSDYEEEIAGGTETNATAKEIDRIRDWLDDREWFVFSDAGS